MDTVTGGVAALGVPGGRVRCERFLSLADDPFAKRKVAVKVAYPEALRNMEDGAFYRNMFLNEAALVGKKAWITAARGDAPRPLPAYEYDATHGLLRFNPLAEWSEAEVDAYHASLRLAA